MDLKVVDRLTNPMKLLRDAERGRLLLAMITYNETSVETQLPGAERLLWDDAKASIDAEKKAIAAEEAAKKIKSEKARESINARWARRDTNVIRTYNDRNSDVIRKEKNQKKDIYISTTSSNSSMSNTLFVENTQVTKSSTPSRNSTRSTEGVRGAGERGVAREVGDGFAAFWAAYPKHKDKQAAIKAWRKINPDAELAKRILDAVESQKKWREWQNTDYVPYPSTWLNGNRWEDEKCESSVPCSKNRAVIGYEQQPIRDEDIAHMVVDFGKEEQQ